MWGKKSVHRRLDSIDGKYVSYVEKYLEIVVTLYVVLYQTVRFRFKFPLGHKLKTEQLFE